MNYSWQRLRGDVAGGVSAAVSGLPVDVNFGLLAMAPLGAAYGPMGVVAAIYATVFAALACALAGGRPGLIPGTRSGLALILASLIAAQMSNPAFMHQGRLEVLPILMLAAACVFLAGVFQIVFGALRLGRVIAFMPQPVMAGLSTGIALSMFLFALKFSLGLALDVGLLQWSEHLGDLRPLSLLVMALSFWLMLHPPAITRRLPAVVAALLVGTLTYHALAAIFGAAALSGMLAPIGDNTPNFIAQDLLVAFDRWPLALLLWDVLPYSLAIAVLASIESLITLTKADMMSNQRHDPDRELMAQGSGNLAAACIGGLPVGASNSRMVANLNAGGSTRLSGVAFAVFVVGLLMWVPHWLGYLPKAVVGGMLLSFAWALIDDWQRRMMGQIAAWQRIPATQRHEVGANAAIVTLVAVVAVVGSLMQAIGVGITAALLIFVRSHARGVVRGVYSGRERHSLKVRNASEAEMLEQAAGRIGIVEADGALFFGSAERLARELEDVAKEADILILDLRRITEVDSTAVRILHQLVRRLRGKQKELLLAHVPLNSTMAEVFSANGLYQVLPRRDWFPDIDAALEAAEDAVLAAAGGEHAAVSTLALEQTDIAADLNPHGIDLLKSALVERHFQAGEAVFRKGDQGAQGGDALYVLTRGSVGIWIPLADGGRRRIAAFGPGVSFGEMALIDGQPRSADAIADGDVVALELRRAAFDALMEQHPAVGRQALLNLSRGLSQRLRNTTLDLRSAVER